MYTGEGAEEIAEKLPGVTDQLIHKHEEQAETFAILNYILGLVALVGFGLAGSKSNLTIGLPLLYWSWV